MNIEKFIIDQIKNNDVVLFMKGTADFPTCGFSTRVVQILKFLNIEFKDIDVLTDQNLREGIKKYTNWPTIPQLYYKAKFIGGCDIISDMFKSGELQELFKIKKN